MADQKSEEIIGDISRRQATATLLVHDEIVEDQLRDDELRMVLMCCHPMLSPDARVALSLKTVGGFSTREIARAFLSDETTIAQRLVRAKRQIRESNISFDLPSGNDLSLRLESVTEVIYLMFNEGYAAQEGEDLVRQDLCGEALRLGQLLASSSVSTPQAHALVALIAFQAARLPARIDASGELVLLEDQDHRLWDPKLIALGFHHFTESAEGDSVSSYHIQAAVGAVYAGTLTTGNIDWRRILGLYDQLMELRPSPIVALNRAVAVSKVDGPEAALAALRPLTEDRTLRNYYLLPAVQGSLLLDLNDRDAAADCFRKALDRPCSEPEKRFLHRKLSECERTP
jgi:RNA polymerase sigma-70 factor (ECF subfamily)